MAHALDTLTALEQLLLERLRLHPRGLNEFDLIKALRAEGEAAFVEADLRDPLSLFRTHFILFNALYRLREQLWRRQEGHLTIHTLRIQLGPYAPGSEGIVENDPLREYYLDLDNLEQTSADDVAAMLGGFWRRVQGGNERHEALAELELEEPVDYSTIKHRYRSLAMRHHPDRGGDKARLQTINAAMAILDKHYGKS